MTLKKANLKLEWHIWLVIILVIYYLYEFSNNYTNIMHMIIDNDTPHDLNHDVKIRQIIINTNSLKLSYDYDR